MDKKEKSFVVNGLRRLSLRWPARTKAKQAARVSRGKYRCSGCNQVVPAGKITIDHQDPVVDPETGFTDWNTFVPRLFCSGENLRALCKECHHTKSKEENKKRRESANANKPKPTKQKRKINNTNGAGPEPEKEL